MLHVSYNWWYVLDSSLPLSRIDNLAYAQSFDYLNVRSANPEKWVHWVVLILKHRETQGRVFSTVTTDALVLKHKTIRIHNAD